MCWLSIKGYVFFQQTLSSPVFDVRNISLVKNTTVLSLALIFYFKWISSDYNTYMGFRLESITNTHLV